MICQLRRLAAAGAALASLSSDFVEPTAAMDRRRVSSS
jgi:hypothetical protein